MYLLLGSLGHCLGAFMWDVFNVRPCIYSNVDLYFSFLNTSAVAHVVNLPYCTG